MAKWKINQAGLKADFKYESGELVGDSYWRLEQDEKPFLEQAKYDRERQTKDNNSKMRKFATIPEIVAIEINEKYGINIHDIDFWQDPDRKAKFFNVMRSDYPHLIVNSH